MASPAEDPGSSRVESMDSARSRPGRAAVGAWAALMLYAAAAALLIILEAGTALYAATAITAAVGVPVIIGVRAFITRTPLRATWLLIGAAMAMNALGDIVFNYYTSSHKTLPSVTLADPLYLATYPLLLAGIGLMIARRNPGALREVMTDAASLAIVAGLVIWQFFVIKPGVLTSGTLVERTVFALYPLMDVMIVAALVTLTVSPGRRSPSMFLTAAFGMAFLTADLFYNIIQVGGHDHLLNHSDALYTLAYGVLAAAAAHPSAPIVVRDPTSDGHASDRSRLVLLGIALIGAPTLAVVTPALDIEYQPLLFILGSVIVALLVLVRLGSLVQRLNREKNRLVAAEAQLAYQASHDSLTGLPNRALLLREIDARIAAGDGGQVAVLFIDLDDFKLVNDSLGHRAGDELLRVVGDRIRDVVREHDLVARLGGDEFVVLCPEVQDVDEAVDVGNRIVAALQTRLQLVATAAYTNGSVGVAMLDGHEDASALLRDADIALYRAKDAGGRCVRVFDGSMRQWAEERLDIETGLRHALAHDKLAVAYQPRVELATGRVTSVEALVRWPESPEVPVTRLIEVAETSGLIGDLGIWVLTRACSDIAALNATRPTPLGVAVNLSAVQLSRATLLDEVRAALNVSGLPAKLLTLELTETFIVEEPEQATLVLESLRRLGVRLEIDDFGVGYSSLARLSRIPLDGVKIDRSFVMALGIEDSAHSIVSAVIALARAIDIQVTGEGVETSENAETLRELHCDFAQGYHYSRPVPIDALVEHLKDRALSLRG